MLAKKINYIEFGILSPPIVRKMSALEIKSPETYDKDGYPMESGLMDPHLGVINPGLRCKTCGQKMKQCPGHFGHVELVRPVVHSEFGKRTEILLHATCQGCGRIVLPDEKLEQFKPFLGSDVDIGKRINAKTKKVKKCPHCSFERGQIFLDKPTNFFLNKERIYPTQIRDWLEKIPNKDLEFFGYTAERIRPEWFVLTALPVPPITIRPSITLESGIKSEDDLTHKLVDIIRINLRLKDNIEAGAPQLIIEDLWDLLQYHVTTYFDNNTAGVPPAKHRSGRALRTLVQRLKGKKGRFRYNLTGKRVNFAARSIITPDPHIGIHELGVPQEVADDLTVPENVTAENIEDMRKLINETDNATYIIRPTGMRKKVTPLNKEEVTKELEPNFKVERKMKNGDIVLFNRQPSLHRLSMLAHQARVMPGKTFRLNPIVCKPYNADFDGDEMNMHVPQTEEGKTEARELMYAPNQVISPRYGAPVIILDEDGVTAAFLMTYRTTRFSRAQTMKYFQLMGLDELPKPDMGKAYSGKLIFSQLLPKDLNLAYDTKLHSMLRATGVCKECDGLNCPHDAYVVIENGVVKKGVVDAASLGEGKGRIVDNLARHYPSEVITRFYNLFSRISSEFISQTGVTVGLDEFDISSDLKRYKDNAIKEELVVAEELVKKFKGGTLEHIPGRTLVESFEIQMMRLGARIKNKVEKKLIEDRIKPFVEGRPTKNSIAMIISGSRGSVVNVTNISGFWGQAAVREGRPKKGFRNRLIAANKKGDVGVFAGGFIQNNFMDGMLPKEYFYHAMGGRQGEVDTGVSTKVSGYLYRRLANALKDLVVNNDETVRTADKNIVQYAYGDDGVFPGKSLKGKAVDIEYALKKLLAAEGKA
ncbi:MAG: DNA-directed RNA polymerase subunit A' [Candidatus Diapherotrites archaeon]|uniref:DNA-directed RNA polymerase subunit n=1 Tax=Candidatus Iainarchaeum sp. TaxID=3101447 RepID=A0A8T4L914_9ARCH|nr:DNA-directed RNA polymerase subunit A' [Candidatus Diapherotrites archaeon]